MTETARSRLLNAGKTLFARLGYEQASTASIAREAGTSESQLVRYFGSKSGLLEGVFNESWAALNEEVTRSVEESEHSRDALMKILTLVMSAFGRDHDLAFLFLFEGRRLRGREVKLSKGFLSFYELVHQLIRRGQEDGSLRNDMPGHIIASALLGCAEGMMRDRIIAERAGRGGEYRDDDIQKAFGAVISSLK